jgi:hypothetical protein
MHFTVSKVSIQFFRLSIREGGGGGEDDINIILKKDLKRKRKGEWVEKGRVVFSPTCSTQPSNDMSTC